MTIAIGLCTGASVKIKMATTHASSVEIVDDVDSLLSLEGSTSEVWKHFGFPAKNGKYVEGDKKKRTKVYCKL